MSEEHGAEDKTEDASHKRVEQAREEGDIPIGRDAVTLSGFCAGAVTLIVCGPELRDSMLALVIASGRSLATARPIELLPLLLRPALYTLAIAAASALGATVAALAQTGGGIWPEKAMPDPKRLIGGGSWKKLFSKQILTDFGLALVKIVALGATIWSALRVDFMNLPRLLGASIDGQLTGLFAPLSSALVRIVAVLFVIAGLDLAITRYRFRQKMKMTKEEAKREYKEDEGDPIFRGRRKRLHRDLLKGVAKTEVPRADALIVNPTHIAIAIRYRPDKDRAPKVTAKGKGVLAEMMRDMARENGIPIVENIPLARLLYRKVKVGRSVPAETYKAVAAVLAFVYRILNRNGDGTGARL